MLSSGPSERDALQTKRRSVVPANLRTTGLTRVNAQTWDNRLRTPPQNSPPLQNAVPKSQNHQRKIAAVFVSKSQTTPSLAPDVVSVGFNSKVTSPSQTKPAVVDPNSKCTLLKKHPTARWPEQKIVLRSFQKPTSLSPGSAKGAFRQKKGLLTTLGDTCPIRTTWVARHTICGRSSKRRETTVSLPVQYGEDLLSKRWASTTCRERFLGRDVKEEERREKWSLYAFRITLVWFCDK